MMMQKTINLIIDKPFELAMNVQDQAIQLAQSVVEPSPDAAPTTAITQFGTANQAIGMETSSHSVLSLFFKADFVVQSVMVMLLLASICCWAIIIEKTIKMKKLRKLAREFEEVFWSGKAMEDIYDDLKGRKNTDPMRAIFTSAMKEWNRSVVRRSGTLSAATSERIERGMLTTLNQELNQLERYLTFLASTGSAAPFIGLFGTVWGIMNSFASIAASKQTSLAVVAPGISEALLATALGLVAAIPASIFYNKISSDLNRYAAKLEAFSAEMSAIFSRQLDEQA